MDNFFYALVIQFLVYKLHESCKRPQNAKN
jgi:hypothetical protein